MYACLTCIAASSTKNPNSFCCTQRPGCSHSKVSGRDAALLHLADWWQAVSSTPSDSVEYKATPISLLDVMNRGRVRGRSVYGLVCIQYVWAPFSLQAQLDLVSGALVKRSWIRLCSSYPTGIYKVNLDNVCTLHETLLWEIVQEFEIKQTSAQQCTLYLSLPAALWIRFSLQPSLINTYLTRVACDCYTVWSGHYAAVILWDQFAS